MTYYLDPYGCVKNQVDAENMMAFLNRSGWAAADNAENADLVIVNSCGFIESAKRESINAVLSWRRLYPEKKILLAGCLAQRYAEELAETLPEADGLFGVSDLSGIARAAEKITRQRAAAPPPGPAESVTGNRAPEAGRRPLLSLPGQAYVKISEGCDNRCAYCAIPLIRGGLVSRPVKDIVEECGVLLDRGIKELCLVGQDSGSYGRDRPLPAPGSNGVSNASCSGLPLLMEALSRLKGNFWIRFLYIHPDNFPPRILDIMEQDRRFIPYFDIPFQHASEKILKAMNRRGNDRIYLELIETIRRRFDDAVIRSTFLAGFPGETEEDFRILLDFQKNARLDWLGCFAYSREEDTPAYSMKGRVPKREALRRKRLLEESQVPVTEKQMDRFVGKTFDVLVEEKFEPAEQSPEAGGVSGGAALYLGRFPFQAPEVDGAAVIVDAGPLEPGALVPCRITARAGFDLEARPLKRTAL